MEFLFFITSPSYYSILSILDLHVAHRRPIYEINNPYTPAFCYFTFILFYFANEDPSYGIQSLAHLQPIGPFLLPIWGVYEIKTFTVSLNLFLEITFYDVCM